MLGPKTFQKMSEMVNQLIQRHEPEVREAYVRAEGGISISLGLKIVPSENKIDVVRIEASINFVQSRVKDSIVSSVDEKQEELIKAVSNLRPNKGSGIDSITFSTGQKSATLEAEK